jgi:hypothetical protein
MPKGPVIAVDAGCWRGYLWRRDTGRMSEAAVRSPFPPGTTEQVIWVDGDGNVLPDQEGAVSGEITVTFPDGRQEHTLFETGR